jgi:hypothetical protein
MPKLPKQPPPGFFLEGPIPVPPHCRELELHYVLGQLSLAEESAIAQIKLLIGLCRYKGGNIGKKGSVTFMRSDPSKLAKVLPNLPKECQYIYFEREPKKPKDGKSATDADKKKEKMISF